VAGALVGLVAKLLGLISRGTSAGFKSEIRSEIHAVLNVRDQQTMGLAEELKESQRRELERIWAAIDDLRRRRS
jgi:hypothetical protein